MRQQLVLISAGWIALGVVSCRNQEASVRLKIVVTDDTQQVINGAYVIIDGKALGLTNQKGILSEEINLKKGALYPLTIGKESSTYYYAPHQDSVAVSEEGIQNVQKFATLYSVPKPQTTVVEKAALTTETATDAPPAEATPAEPEADPIASTKPSLEQAVQDAMAATPIAQEAALLRVRVMTVDQKGLALPGVEILAGDQEQGTISSFCKSDTTGVCSGTVTTFPGREFNFIARKDGYVTASRKVSVQNALNAKMTLEAGNGIDLTLISANDEKTGVANAPVFIGEKKVGVTDQFGHYFYRFHKQTQQLKALRVTFPDAPQQTALSLDLYEGVSQTVWKKVRAGKAQRETPVILPVIVSSNETKGTVNLDDVKRRAKIIDGWLEQFARMEKLTLLQQTDTTFRFNGESLIADRPVAAYTLVAEMQLGHTDQLELRLLNKAGHLVWNNVIALGVKDTKDQVKLALLQSLEHLPVYGSVRKIEGNIIVTDFGTSLAKSIATDGKFEIESLVTDQQGMRYHSERIALNTLPKADVLWTQLTFDKLPQRTTISVGDPVTFNPTLGHPVVNFFKGKAWLRVIAPGHQMSWQLESKGRSIPLLADNLMSWTTLGETVQYYPVIHDQALKVALNQELRPSEQLLVVTEQSSRWLPLQAALRSLNAPTAEAQAKSAKTDKM